MVRSTTVLLIASSAAMLAVVADAQPCSMTLDEQFGGVGVYVGRRFKTNTQDCPSDWDDSIDRSECPKADLNAMLGDSTAGLLLQECQIACTDDAACKAVQYKSGGDGADSICELFNVLPSYKLTKRSRGSRLSSIHPRHGESCTLNSSPAEQPGDPNEVPCPDATDIARFSVHANFRRTSAWRNLGVKVDSAAACAALCVADGDSCNAFETSSFTPNNDKNGNARAEVTNCYRIAANLPLVEGVMTETGSYKPVASSFRTFTLYDQNDDAC